MTKKTGFTLFLLLIFIAGYSQQTQKKKNLSNFDRKKIHFGFSLGVNSASYRLQTNLLNADSLISLEPISQSGFNLAIVSDLHINEHFSLRFIPGLSFAERRMNYVFIEGGRRADYKDQFPVESTYVDFPFNLKYRSVRYNNFAAYMVAGGQYSLDLISQQDVDNSAKIAIENMVVKTKKNIVSAQFGFGFDFFLEYFKFSPEFKWSMGVHDAAVKDGTILSDPVDAIYPKMFIVAFTFEG